MLLSLVNTKTLKHRIIHPETEMRFKLNGQDYDQNTHI